MLPLFFLFPVPNMKPTLQRRRHQPLATTHTSVEVQKASSAETKPVQHGSDDYLWIGGGTSAKVTSGSADPDGKHKACRLFWFDLCCCDHDHTTQIVTWLLYVYRNLSFMHFALVACLVVLVWCVVCVCVSSQYGLSRSIPR